jgi:HD-GYP domain-containing protein (c-di-GMP phosphodiesterase class II)
VTLQRENFDGSGGPMGLRTEEIPQASRILRVADEYDLIRQPKGSVALMTHEEAVSFLTPRSGKQFDPEIIEILQQVGPDSMSVIPDAADLPTNNLPGHKAFVDSFVPSFSETIVS